MRIWTPIIVLLLGGMLFHASPAWAWKTSVVSKVDGRTQVVKVAPDSHWLAAWMETSPDVYSLVVVDDNNGKQVEVTTSNNPGGFCWIPRNDQLFFCKAQYIEPAKTFRVIYYIYDPNTKETRKLTDVPDVLETFRLDPVAADDGSVAFHMTIGQGNMPSFNVYHSADGVLRPFIAEALPDTNYDLSNDGSAVWWTLSDAEGNLYFVRWDLETNREVWNVKFLADSFIADGGGLMKVDAANQRAASMAWCESQPRLQMYIFSWTDHAPLRPHPVFLENGEEFIHYDWKGITGKLYGVIHNEFTSQFSITILDPFSGLREVLVKGTDEIAYVDYSPGKDRYYYAVINEAGSKTQTYFIRLEN